jgi:hypothetical protein
MVSIPSAVDSARRGAGQAGRVKSGDILCQPSDAHDLERLGDLAGLDQAAGAGIVARARLRLATWTASS